MEIIFVVIVVLVFFFLLLKYVLFKKKTLPPTVPLSPDQRQLLSAHVDFYTGLSADQQKVFEHRMQHFLLGVKITGVKTTVEELDKLLIAASAIIPIFGFPEWEYPNLHEVLLYPDSFSEEFAHEGEGRNILGLVGTGPYQHVMLLSKQQLRGAFENKTGKDNTAIHEFVHLIDKTDGEVDGIPESLLSRQYSLPWVRSMHASIKQIMENRSDINPYGATNEAEFFAVVSEYFFERPDLLQSKHPELYDLLVTIFRQEPGK